MNKMTKGQLIIAQNRTFSPKMGCFLQKGKFRQNVVFPNFTPKMGYFRDFRQKGAFSPKWDIFGFLTQKGAFSPKIRYF